MIGGYCDVARNCQVAVADADWVITAFAVTLKQRCLAVPGSPPVPIGSVNVVLPGTVPSGVAAGMSGVPVVAAVHVVVVPVSSTV